MNHDGDLHSLVVGSVASAVVATSLSNLCCKGMGVAKT